MPSWVRDHDTWERAKKEVKRKRDMTDDQYWATVTTVYKNMGGKVGSRVSELISLRDVMAAGDDEETVLPMTPGVDYAPSRIRQKTKISPTQEEVKEESPEDKSEKILKLLLGIYYENLRKLLPNDPGLRNWDQLNPNIDPIPKIEDLKLPKIERVRDDDDDDPAPKEASHKMSSASFLGRIQRAERRALAAKNLIAAAKLRAVRGILLADFDPGQISWPFSEEVEPPDLSDLDSYQGLDPMSGPGVSVKMEAGQTQVYVILDPEQESYAELYLDPQDEGGWVVSDMAEYNLSEPILPEDWSVGIALSSEEVRLWIVDMITRLEELEGLSERSIS